MDDERQRRRHHAPNIQRAMIQDRKQPRGVDAHQPVCLGAAERRVVKPVKVRAVVQVRESIQNCVVLHGRKPQSLHWLFASNLFVDVPEDGFALAPGVAAVDDLGHVLALHERFQDGKLFFLCVRNLHAPRVGDDGKVGAVPFCVAFVVGFRTGKLHQMPEAPRNEPTAALHVTVHPLLRAQHYGIRHAHRRFFCNY